MTNFIHRRRMEMHVAELPPLPNQEAVVNDPDPEYLAPAWGVPAVVAV